LKILEGLAKRNGQPEVSFYLESGAGGMKELDRLIREQRDAGKLGLGRCQFLSGDVHMLQTADVLAYESVKRLKDRVDSKKNRLLRKSLKSIISDNPDHRIAPLNDELLWRIPELLH
jgi:hypothetical protein